MIKKIIKFHLIFTAIAYGFLMVAWAGPLDRVFCIVWAAISSGLYVILGYKIAVIDAKKPILEIFSLSLFIAGVNSISILICLLSKKTCEFFIVSLMATNLPFYPIYCLTDYWNLDINLYSMSIILITSFLPSAFIFAGYIINRLVDKIKNR